MTVPEGAVAGWLADVAPAYPWGGRRGVDDVAPGLEARVLLAAYEDAHDADARVHVVADGDRPLATTIRSPKPLESESFGLVTASLSPVVCPIATEGRGEVVAGLLDGACDEAADDGVDLLVLRVDADDVTTLAAAQAAGFAVCEATTTWLADSAIDAEPVVSGDDIEIEVHEGDVAGALTPDDVARLATATSPWEMNHFSADPLLPSSAVARFYDRWIHNIASGEWSDCLVVARRDGRVVGIESEVADRDLTAATGVVLRAGEWIVVLEPGLGIGSALMATAGRHRPPGGRFHSWETQLRNSATVRCIARSGVARPLRAGYTLHAWPRR